MQQLNLPQADLRIKEEEGNQFIFDIVRKKYLVLTPEEWVRQHFLHLLITHLKYPKSLIKMESGMNYFKSNKRSDILVLKRNLDPFMLIECKAAHVPLQKQTINQASVYNKVIKAEYMAITNGMKHFIWQLKDGNHEVMNSFPEYPEG